jgi:DNA-binding protein YbaB
VQYDPEDVLRSIESRVEAQTRRSLQLSADLAAVEVTTHSENGAVTVRVNSAGGLTDLQFHREADNLSREDLARLVLAISKKAQAKLAERVAALVSSIYGGTSDTAALITDAYAGRYAAPDEEEP